MTKTFKTLITVITFIFSTSIGFAQTNGIKIRCIRDCGLHITDRINHIYRDIPYKSGAYNYIEYEDSNLIV